MTAEEKKWHVERDARTLKDYAEVSADKARYAAAKALLEKEAELIDAAIQGFKDGGV